MQTGQTFTTTRGGKWIKCVGGKRQYCSLGQHFTTGPTFKWFLTAQAHVCTAVVCETCATKEQA